ncbi:HNH endonuclease [Candidatus Pacearchaeota archaeon]|nr:HNH endonuclease [Candidatus Pacearchaeota archaeon]
MKLEIELVPSTAWYSNLRNKVKKDVWDKIRKKSYVDANYRCSICLKDKKRLNCHEIWEYNDEKHLQRLKGFLALCDDCHMIKHIGFAGIQASKGIINMKKLITHFMKVNEVTREHFNKHHKEAFDLWGERSKEKWTTDLGEWSNLINR